MAAMTDQPDPLPAAPDPMSAGTRLAGLLPPSSVAEWLARIDRAWARLASDALAWAPARPAPHGTSLPLAALAPEAPLDLWQSLDQAALRRWCEPLLGPALVLNASECWVRRQPAPGRRLPGQAPHSWHQDGALRFDFPGHPVGTALPLRMVTCWIALTPCGDQAPGLEWMATALPRLLRPAELTDAAVRTAWPARAFERPGLGPGDALVFGGGTLHRTHVVPGMTLDRTSVELRLFSAGDMPGRLAGDRFVRL